MPLLLLLLLLMMMRLLQLLSMSITVGIVVMVLMMAPMLAMLMLMRMLMLMLMLMVVDMVLTLTTILVIDLGSIVQLRPMVPQAGEGPSCQQEGLHGVQVHALGSAGAHHVHTPILPLLVCHIPCDAAPPGGQMRRPQMIAATALEELPGDRRHPAQAARGELRQYGLHHQIWQVQQRACHVPGFLFLFFLFFQALGRQWPPLQAHDRAQTRGETAALEEEEQREECGEEIARLQKALHLTTTI
jgi:hypothetical protein